MTYDETQPEVVADAADAAAQGSEAAATEVPTESGGAGEEE